MSDGWEKWQNLVLSEIKRLDSSIKETNQILRQLQLENNTLKVKAGVWGLLAGAIPVCILIAIETFVKSTPF